MKFWDLVEEKDWLAFLGSSVILVAFLVITMPIGMAISQFFQIDCDLAMAAIWFAIAGLCYCKVRH